MIPVFTYPQPHKQLVLLRVPQVPHSLQSSEIAPLQLLHQSELYNDLSGTQNTCEHELAIAFLHAPAVAACGRKVKFSDIVLETNVPLTVKI